MLVASVQEPLRVAMGMPRAPFTVTTLPSRLMVPLALSVIGAVLLGLGVWIAARKGMAE